MGGPPKKGYHILFQRSGPARKNQVFIFRLRFLISNLRFRIVPRQVGDQSKTSSTFYPGQVSKKFNTFPTTCIVSVKTRKRTRDSAPETAVRKLWSFSLAAALSRKSRRSDFYLNKKTQPPNTSLQQRQLSTETN